MKWHIDKKPNGAHILHMSVDGGLNFSTVVNQSNNKSIQLLDIREAIADIKRGWGLSCSKRCAAIRKKYKKNPAKAAS